MVVPGPTDDEGDPQDYPVACHVLLGSPNGKNVCVTRGIAAVVNVGVVGCSQQECNVMTRLGLWTTDYCTWGCAWIRSLPESFELRRGEHYQRGIASALKLTAQMVGMVAPWKSGVVEPMPNLRWLVVLPCSYIAIIFQ